MGVFLWPVGLPALVGALFFCARNNLPPPGTTTADKKGNRHFDRFEFLMAGYKAQYFFWGPLELMYVISLSGALVFFNPGSTAQIHVSVAIVLFAIVLVVAFRPYEDDRSNGFAVGSHVALVLILLVSLAARPTVAQGQLGFAFDPDVFVPPSVCGVFLLLCAVGLPALGVRIAPRLLKSQKSTDADVELSDAIAQ